MKINLLHIALLSTFLMNSCDRDDKNSPQPACDTHTLTVFPYNESIVPDNSPIDFSWEASAVPKSFDVYLGSGTNEPTLIGTDISTTTYTYTLPLGTDITYTWYVKAKNSMGVYIGCQETRTFFKSQTLPALDEQQKVVNVLVLNYDPEMTINGTAIKLHQFGSWGDTRSLADEYISDVFISSHNLIKYNIVEWRDLDEFPVKTDGFVYTDDDYFMCMFGGAAAGCHQPDGLDYVRMIDDQNIVEGINQDLYEEVWLFGGPYFGFWEASMAGPGAFNINGGVYGQVPTKRAFAIMGFNYERGVAEMMHDLCHRTEGTMSRVYGGWRAEELTTSWARFAANITQSGFAAVGSCHYPPNALTDYDYANDRFVSSSADDWFNYPLSTGKKSLVNRETWGPPDYQRTYLNWWFNHLPRREGVAPDGKLNSWWRYVFEFNETILH